MKLSELFEGLFKYKKEYPIIKNPKKAKAAIEMVGNYSGISESLLSEAINISFDDIQKIKQFLLSLESKMIDTSFKSKQFYLERLAIVLNDIFEHYAGDSDYNITVEIEESQNKYGGNTYANWEYDLKSDKWNNTLTLVIPYNHFDVNQIISIITHELTHLIQSYSSSKKKINTSFKPSDGKTYYNQKHEIDAYAQSIVTNIIMKSNGININSIDNNIKILQGLSKLPLHLPVFDYIKQHYDTYKKYFKIPVSLNDIKTWQRLNKKIIQKLQYYKDIHEFKYGGIPYTVYDKDGDNYGTVYKPKDKPFKQFNQETIAAYGDDGTYGLFLKKQISKPSLP
jgi:hypothetical protein